MHICITNSLHICIIRDPHGTAGDVSRPFGLRSDEKEKRAKKCGCLDTQTQTNVWRPNRPRKFIKLN